MTTVHKKNCSHDEWPDDWPRAAIAEIERREEEIERLESLLRAQGTAWKEKLAEAQRAPSKGAWVNSIFRNEGAGLSSDLIRHAVAATRAHWPEVPALGMVSFVDASKVRGKRDPGYCFLKAGFRNVGATKGGLVALQLLPEDMPEACPIPFALSA